MTKEEVFTKIKRLIDNIEQVIKGKREVIRLAVLALLCEGHLLIEDVPGVGKTMLARSLAKSLKASFKRIQFTPDMLPSDITGTTIFNQKTGDFQFSPGPIFASVILADEINRTTPRTQSSLLEAMEEQQITVDGLAHPLPRPFFVVATQNPLEYHGTYPLPEGQLDRFLMSLSLGYPAKKDEEKILRSQKKEHPINTIGSVLETPEVLELQQAIKTVFIDKSLIDYVLEIVFATRSNPDLVIGVSPRGTLGLTRAAQAMAASEGRDFVLPDDIKQVAPAILSHRVLLKPQLRVGKDANRQAIDAILDKIPVPVKRD